MSLLVAPEPHALHMQRIPTYTDDTLDVVDYRKVPRSSGDGMEHNGTAHEPSSQTITVGDTKTSTVVPVSHVDNKQSHSDDAHKHHKHHKHHRHHRHDDGSQRTHSRIHDHLQMDTSDIQSDITNQGDSSQIESRTHERTTGNILLSENKEIHFYPRLSPQVENNYHPSIFNTISADTRDSDTLLERSEIKEDLTTEDEIARLKLMVSKLEEQNSKLADDKTKLVVQLGIQTEVNSDLKKLLVASMGEDLENRLEALAHKNAMLGVEVEHWKNLSQEYAEESDRLAIDCDVWRTKFMASRMMSDELSSWKTTLYARYKQAQTVLQKILDERAELQHYLLQTKRLLQSLDYVIKCSTGNYHDENMTFSEKHHSTHEQSILEMASISCCLVQDLTSQIQGIVPSTTLPMQTLLLGDEEKHKVDSTPAEKLALQVLGKNIKAGNGRNRAFVKCDLNESCDHCILLLSDVELPTGDTQLQQESTVMKRLGQQYIGNSYHSRQMTNCFRVTYDCCDRCKGPVHVV